MKKQLVFKLLIVLLLLSNYCLGQLPYSYARGVLTINQLNGVNADKKLTFILTENDYDLINNSERFRKWEAEMFSKYAGPNRDWLISHKDWDRVIAYIDSEIKMSIFYTKAKLKNENSFDFVDQSKGFIYFKNSNMIISFNFKAQNGVGNFITSKSNCSFGLKDGNRTSDCAIE